MNRRAQPGLQRPRGIRLNVYTSLNKCNEADVIVGTPLGWGLAMAILLVHFSKEARQSQLTSCRFQEGAYRALCTH